MYNRRWLRLLSRQRKEWCNMKLFGSIKDKAGSAGKKVFDITGWIAMFIAIMAVVGIGGFIITAVVVNYQTLWAMISDGVSQIFSDHWGWIILINALIIGGVTFFSSPTTRRGHLTGRRLPRVSSLQVLPA